MDSPVYFVENLTVQEWVLSVWPRLLRGRLRTRRRATPCYVIDGSQFAMLIARSLARIAGVAVKRLAFTIGEVRDEEGVQTRLRILYQDLGVVQQDAIAEPVFQELVQRGLLQDRLPMFLAKNITAVRPFDRNTVWRALNLVQVCIWKAKQEEGKGSVPILFLERRPWLKAIRRYASLHGVTIIPVRTNLNVRVALRRRLPQGLIDKLRYLRYRASWRSLLSFKQRASSGPLAIAASAPAALPDGSGSVAQKPRPRVAVDYYGQLNLNRPECHSQLFFWQKSSLPGRDVLVTFVSPSAPADEQTWTELREHGMAAVALHPGATTIPDVPVFTHHNGRNRTQRVKLPAKGYGPESRWLREQATDYYSLRSYWTGLFEAHNVKVYVTWDNTTAAHFAIADALQSLGGVATIYQRSYETHPSVGATVGADIVFGFSQRRAEVERLSNSAIRYHVTTGFLGDHRFPLLRDSAQAVRDSLQKQGARRILAYFDENTSDDVRWHYGHYVTQVNYAFLLEKVLAEPWLGLVMKPKTPRTLRRRLGPVAELLERAEATGRCYVYEASGPVQGWYPPAAAALAADIAVHGHLAAATAGVESALAGVPTLMLDRDGSPMSPLYRLGVGRVVFTDWEGLWEACKQHWSSSEGITGFGDWSPMLDELDPFRDGRAAERMGTYIQWLIGGFGAGLDRETVMADAAERYCALWGRGKVTQINSGFCRRSDDEPLILFRP